MFCALDIIFPKFNRDFPIMSGKRFLDDSVIEFAFLFMFLAVFSFLIEVFIAARLA